MRRIVMAVAAVAATLVATLIFAPSASAHSRVVSTNPADGASVATGPQTITITFNEAVSPDFAELNVVGPDKRYWQAGKPTTQGSTLSAPVRALGPAGEYTVNWRVTSADGHPVEGKLRFTLTTAGTGTPGEAVSGGTSDSSSVPVWPFIVGGVAVFGIGLGAALYLVRGGRGRG